MTRKYLMVGMSAIAFAAGTANAQYNVSSTGSGTGTNTSYGPDSAGNRAIVNCGQGTNNQCTIAQGNVGQTFNSTGSIGVYGSNNNATIDQQGNNNLVQTAVGLSNNASAYNSSTVTQRGFTNTALVSQNGVGASGALANVANIQQGNSAAAGAGSANGNNVNNSYASVVQTLTLASGTTTATGNSSTIQQGVTTTTLGTANSATSTQNGSNLTSRIIQADINTVGGGTVGTVANGAAGTTGVAASNNVASVTQTGLRGNATTGSSSTVVQSQRGNSATVALYDGGTSPATQGGTPTAASRNDSYVQQSNQYNSTTDTGFTTGSGGSGFAQATGAGSITTNNDPSSGNNANVAVIGQQNNSVITQNGVQNSAIQTLSNGGSGNTSAANFNRTNPYSGVTTVPANRIQGNSSTINQTGRGNAAATSIGGNSTYVGQGNTSQITQSQTDATVTQASASNNSATLTASQGHRANVYQRGILDGATISQSNNTLGGTGGATTQSGSFADVSQLTFNSTVSVTQVGTNYALVSQGSAGAGADSLTINQIDAGDLITSGSGGTTGTTGTFGGTSGSAGSGATSAQASNYVAASQTGIENTATIAQNAVNASASLYQNNQTRGSNINIQQGTQATGGSSNVTAGFTSQQTTAQQNGGSATGNFATSYNLVANVQQTGGQQNAAAVANNQGSATASVNSQTGGITVVQGGHDLNATANQSGGTATASGTAYNTANNSGNSILIGQAGSFNNTSVTQASVAGVAQVATVEQRGNGGSATQNNLITVSQTGTTVTGTLASGNNNNYALARQTSTAAYNGAAASTATTATDPNGTNSRSGANTAEIRIFQTGFGNSATVEQRGAGQFASVTQNNTGSTATVGQTASILQGASATNAVAIINQTGGNNTYQIYQDQAGQFARVTQNGSGNNVISASGALSGTGGTIGGAAAPLPATGFGAAQ